MKVLSFKVYPEVKTTQLTTLPAIPENWDFGSLRWYIKIASGESLPADLLSESANTLSPHKVIGGNGVQGYSKCVNTTGSAIAIGRVGALCGNVHAITDDCWVTDNALKISYWSDFQFQYLIYVLKASDLNQYASRSAQPLITGETVKSLTIAIPTWSEQQKIANFLDHETAKIDTLIEKQQQLIKLLKEKRQAVISHAVTKGLNPDAPMKDSRVEWLGEVPEGWSIAQLKFNALEMQTGPFGSQLHAEEYVNNGIPLINPAHMNDGRIAPDMQVTVDEATSIRLERHQLTQGDLIFARRGDLGRCAVVSKFEEGWLCGTGSLRATLSPKLVPEYSYLLVTSPGVVSELSLESKGSTMENLNTETLGRIRLPIPPIREQQQILEYVHDESGRYRDIVTRAEEAISLMQERRTALISAAVTGKIDVRKWQPPKTTATSSTDA